MVFAISERVGQPSFLPNSWTFSSSQKKLSLFSFYLFPLAPGPREPLTYFLSRWTCLFWILHINGLIQHTDSLLYLLHTQHHVFKVHPCDDAARYPVSFHGWILFCRVRYHVLFTSSSVDGHLGRFHFWTTMNHASVNVHAQGFVWTYVFNSPVYIFMSGNVGLWVILCLTFWETAKLFSRAAVPFCCPSSNVRGL